MLKLISAGVFYVLVYANIGLVKVKHFAFTSETFYCLS